MLDPADLVDSDPVADDDPGRGRAVAAPDGGVVEELAIGAPEAILALADPDRRGTDAHGTPWSRRGAAPASGWSRWPDGSTAEPWAVRALIGFADPIRDGIREALETARTPASRSSS